MRISAVDFQQDGIVRFRRWIIGERDLLQFGILYHIAAPGKDTALRLALFPPDPLEVQQLKHLVRKICQLLQKIILRIESSQLGIIAGFSQHMAAVRVVSQLDQRMDGDLPLLFFLLHPEQPFKGNALPIVQSRQLLRQSVQMIQGTVRGEYGFQVLKVQVLLHLKVHILCAVAAHPLQRILYFVWSGRQGEGGIAILISLRVCEIQLKDFVQVPPLLSGLRPAGTMRGLRRGHPSHAYCRSP